MSSDGRSSVDVERCRLRIWLSLVRALVTTLYKGLHRDSVGIIKALYRDSMRIV